MAFLITAIYVVLSHLSPAALLPELAPYRIMLWLAIAAAILCLPRLVFHRTLWQSVQIYLMLGFIVAVPLSRLAHGWLGGVFPAFSDFLVSGIVFFLVVASVNTVRKVQILMAAMVVCALFLLSQSLYGFHVDGENSQYVIIQNVEKPNGEIIEAFPRLRSVGFLEDPNDFAQFLLVIGTFLMLAWKPEHRFRNLVIVLVPLAYMAYGIYATDSRGALFGVAVLLAVALEKYVSRKKALIITAVLLVGFIVVQAAGPRAISLNEASAGGRVEAWGTGISMLEHSPLFGAGYNSFEEVNGRTAHNSFVLCFAELGIFGYMLWLGTIVFTLGDLDEIGRNQEALLRAPQVMRCARVIRAALLTYLATSWFLSRTYTVTFYMLIGMAVATRELLQRHPEMEPSEQRSRWGLTVALAASSMVVVYLTVRLRTL